MRSRYYCCLLLCVILAMAQCQVGCLQHAIIDLEVLRGIVDATSDISLYSPDLDDMNECGKETLQCFHNELSVLDFEFDGILKQSASDRIFNLRFSIQFIISQLNITRGCQQCEIYNEESASTFFRRLETLLQHQNRFICPFIHI